MSSTAFVAHPLPATRPRRRTHALACRPRAPVAVASDESHVRAKPRTHVRAPVVDSRVAGVSENHHWISIRAASARAFERAAAANASVTAVVEARENRRADRRWVLRQVADPSLGFIDGGFSTDCVMYVVMEAFPDISTPNASSAHTERWLSAVRRTSRAFGAVGIQSLPYHSVFAARRHHARPQEDTAVVVLETVAVDTANASIDDVLHILRSGAEATVSAGECIDFSVLQAKGAPSLFKTVEVYQDVDAMRAHIELLDRAFVRRTKGKLVGTHRERYTFKAILFD